MLQWQQCGRLTGLMLQPTKANICFEKVLCPESSLNKKASVKKESNSWKWTDYATVCVLLLYLIHIGVIVVCLVLFNKVKESVQFFLYFFKRRKKFKHAWRWRIKALAVRWTQKTTVSPDDSNCLPMTPLHADTLLMQWLNIDWLHRDLGLYFRQGWVILSQCVDSVFRWPKLCVLSQTLMKGEVSAKNCNWSPSRPHARSDPAFCFLTIHLAGSSWLWKTLVLPSPRSTLKALTAQSTETQWDLREVQVSLPGFHLNGVGQAPLLPPLQHHCQDKYDLKEQSWVV